MTTVSLASPDRSPADVLIVAIISGPAGPVLAEGALDLPAALRSQLATAFASLGLTGKLEETARIPTLGLAPFGLLVTAGLGPAERASDPESVRRAIGAAIRAVGEASRVTVDVGLATVAGVAPQIAAMEGALLGSYTFESYKSGSRKKTGPKVSLVAADPRSRALTGGARRARVLADAIALTRDLVNTPPNDLAPADLAARLVAAAQSSGAASEVLDERALRRGGYGGVLGVGGGSSRPPRLVRLHHRPARARARIALVGKGITFDTGGLNLKNGTGMATMKSDMGGAAAAAATVLAAAALKLPVEVSATVALAENMVSGTSYRPSDVLTLHSGKTVEITNTDAEGRVVLADALSRACADDPQYLLEASTLTGAQVVALGNRIIAAMGEPELRDQVAAIGCAAGESVWAMPLPEDLRSGLESPIADLSNLPSHAWGGMLMAGLFLSEFITDGLPWVHLDIAGPSYNSGAAHGYTPKGGTGAGVRTMLATIEDLAG